jgi:hypothetical protein
MALIVLHHTIADNFQVDPTITWNSTNRLVAGTIVGLNSSGYVQIPNATAANAGGVAPLGIAGDSASDAYKTDALSADLVVSPGRALNGGATHVAGMRWTSNRVSDMFNETLASGEMTVYIGSGLFATDQYVATDTFIQGQPVYATATGQVTVTSGSNGLARHVGYCKNTPTDYPSGVPGVDAPSVQNSMSLGQFLTFFLSLS